MEENKNPLINRAELENRFSGYTSEQLGTSPNISYRGLDLSTPDYNDSSLADDPLQDLTKRLLSIPDDRNAPINRRLSELTNDRYPYYIPGDYNNEDAYAQSQGFASKMISGVGKGLVLTGTTFLQTTAGLLNGTAQWIKTGKFTSFYNNDFNNYLDNINKTLEDKLANYYTDVEKDARWYSPDKLFTGNFLWDGIVKNLGFAAGAWLSGGAFAAGIKGLASLPGLAKLVSIGKGAEALATAEAQIAKTAQIAGTLGKLEAANKGFLSSYKILSPAGRTLVAGLATTGEAGIEALHNLNQFREAEIQEFIRQNGYEPTGKDLEEINQRAALVGNNSFILNMSLLSVTNSIQFPKILGSSYKSERGIINGIARQTRPLIKEGDKIIEEVAKGGKIWQGIKKFAPYTFSTSEAFEEGSQYAITVGVQDYFNKKNEDPEVLDSLIEGMKAVVTTDEGMENVLIGGLSGAIMLGKGRYRERQILERNTKEALRTDKWKNTGLNSANLSDFTKDTIDSVSRGTVIQQEREQLIKDGNIVDSKDKEADYIINYLSPRIKHGRFDLVISDINDYRELAGSDEGFDQLVREGKALKTDTRESYLKRLQALEDTANHVKNLYQSIYLRYGDKTNDKGDLLYSPEVIDKMVYAASKIVDYDRRIPELKFELLTAIPNIDQVIQDINDGKNESYDAAIVELKKLDNAVTNDDFQQKLSDVGKIVIRRKQFLQEYEDIKNSPAKYQEVKTKPIPSQEKGSDTETKTIKVETQKGEKELEIGEQYYVGKTVKYNEKGERETRPNWITILKDNGDGSIQIRDKHGVERAIAKSVLKDYRLGKTSVAKADPVVNFFMRNWDKKVFWNIGKGRKPIEGELEHDPDTNQLLFTYTARTKKGKPYPKSIPVEIESFTPKKGFKKGLFYMEGNITKEDQADITKQKEIKKGKGKIYEMDKHSGRMEMLNDLYTYNKKRQQETTELINELKQDLNDINEEYETLRKKIESSEESKATKKGLKLKPTVRKAFKRIKELTDARDEIIEEIALQEHVLDEIEGMLPYLQDAVDNLNELEGDVENIKEDLKLQVLYLEDNVKSTSKQLDLLTKLKDELQSVIDNVVDFISDLVNSYFKLYPKTPLTSDSKTWVEFLKENPNFLKLKPTAFNDIKALEIMVAEIEDSSDVPANEKMLAEAENNIDAVQKTLKELVNEINAKNLLIKAFDKAYEKFKQSEIMEDRLANNKDVVEAFVGIEKSESLTRDVSEGYELESKKNTQLIPFSTTTTTDKKPHHLRANRFGFRLNKLPKAVRDNIRGVFITTKTQDQLFPELKGKPFEETIIGKFMEGAPKEVKPEQAILMVMVTVNNDGSLSPIDEFGNPIPENVNKSDFVIGQFKPLPTFKWSADFGNKSVFRENTPQEVIDEVTDYYTKQREDIIASSDIKDNVHTIKASFGFPEFEQKLDEKGNPVKNENNKIKIDFDKKNSIEDAGLVDPSKIGTDVVIFVPTTSDVVDGDTTTYKNASGTPFLKVGDNFTPLQNRKHSKRQANNIFEAIKHLAQLAVDGKKPLKSDPMLNFLQSVVYWGIPETKNGYRKPDAYSGIYFEYDQEKKKLMLHISGKGLSVPFSPAGLIANKEELLKIFENLYANVNVSLIRDFQKPYVEVQEIKPNGKIISRDWKNYQAYLLSKTFIPADDNDKRKGEARPVEEIPLTTVIRNLKNEEDVNRDGIYFYTTDNNVDTSGWNKTKKPSDQIQPKRVQAAPQQQQAPQAPPQTPVSSQEKPFIVGEVYNISIEGWNVTFQLKGDLNELNFRDNIVIKSGLGVTDLVNKGVDLDKIIFDTVTSTNRSLFDSKLGIKRNSEVEKIISDNKKNGLPPVARVSKPLTRYTPENWKAFEEWWKKNLPNIPVYRVKRLMETSNGTQLWGLFQKGAMYVYENAEIGTGYHEAFEAVWKMFTPENEQAEIHKEFKQREGSFKDRESEKIIKYSEATPQQIKEQLAEEFRDYVLNKKIPPKPEKGKPFILKMFSDLVTFIREIFYGKESSSRIATMFKHINQGGYKTRIPFQSQLEQAIIDIDNVDVDSEAEFREAKLTDGERASIMEHMTYELIKKLTYSDSDLFKKISVDKYETYNDIRTSVIIHADSLINSNSTLEEKNSIIQLENLIVDEWESLMEQHRNYLTKYDVEFDENDDFTIRNEDKIKNSDYVDARKIDSFKKIPTAIKLLLSSVPVVDDKGNLVPSITGGATLLPVSTVYIKLKNALYNSRSVDDMLEKLKALSNKNSNYKVIYNRIAKRDVSEPGIDLFPVETGNSLNLLTAFYSTFVSQNPEVKNLYIHENGEVQLADAPYSTAANHILRTFENGMRFAARNSDKYIVYDKDKKAFVGNTININSLVLDNFHKRLAFINSLGIAISKEEAQSDIDGFTQTTNAILKGMKDGVNLISLSSKSLDIRGRLLELAYIKAKYNTPETDSTFFGINGDRLQSFIGVNTSYKLYNFLSQIKSYTRNQLAGTQFHYLLTDVFSKNSVILRKKFAEDGQPINTDFAKNLLKVVYLGGIDNLQKGKSKESSRLSLRERFILTLNANFNGYYQNLVQGDGNIEWATYMGNHVPINQLSSAASIIKGYFIDEVNLSKEKNRNIDASREANRKDLRFFKGILASNKSLYATILSEISSGTDALQIYENHQKEIISAFNNFIASKNEKLLKTLNDYKLIEYTEKGITVLNTPLERDMSKEQLNDYLSFFNINFLIANTEFHKLVYGDPYLYKYELKYIKNALSPRTSLLNTSEDSPDINNKSQINHMFDLVWNEGFAKGDLGWTDFSRDFFRTATFDDVRGINKDLAKYGVFDGTDGGAIISLKAARNFRIHLGTWSDANERQYKYDMIGWRVLRNKMNNIDKYSGITPAQISLYEKGNPMIRDTYTSIKPIATGSKGDGNSYNDFVVDKYAVYPMSYRMAEAIAQSGGKEMNNLMKLMDAMEKNDIDYIIFKSARKVGAKDLHTPYKEGGEFNDNPFAENTIINIPFAILSKQTEVSSKDDHKSPRGTQPTKLMTLDFMDAGVPIDFMPTENFDVRYKAWDEILKLNDESKYTPLYKEIKRNRELLEAMTEVGYQNLLLSLGIQEEMINGEKSFVIVDFSESASLLRQEILKRDANTNLIAAINRMEQLEEPLLEVTPAYHLIRNILYSIADREVISQKINGGMLVQISSAFFESGAVREEEINGKKGYVSDVLKFYEKDGERICEIMASRWFDTDMSDRELLEYLNNTEEGKKILRGVAFRIPTQKQNSIDRFVIKQFLPYEFGDNVVVPADIVEKVGSDFDIDKLTLYLKNVTTFYDKKLKKTVPKLVTLQDDTNSTVLQRYGRWVVKHAKKDVRRYINFLNKDVVKKLRADFKERMDEISGHYKRMTSDVNRIENSFLHESYKSVYEEIKTEQDREMISLFENGSWLFRYLSDDVKYSFRQIKNYLAENNVNGVAEMEYYLDLSRGIRMAYDAHHPNWEYVTEDDANILSDMIEIYEQEIKVLGGTKERIQSRKDELFANFKKTTSDQIANIVDFVTALQEETKEERNIEFEIHNEEYINELATLSGLMSVEEFGKLPIYEQNDKKALENEYIDSSEKLISHPLNFDRLTEPNSAKELSDLADDIGKLIGKEAFSYTDPANMLDMVVMTNLRQAFVSGKHGIGIAATSQTNNAGNQRTTIIIDPERRVNLKTKEKFWMGDGVVNFEKYNTIALNGKTYPTLSKAKNAAGEYISDIIGQFIDGSVDVAGKLGPWIVQLGATPNVISTWLFLVKIGVPIRTVAYFMNQPIIREYLQEIENKGYSWLFIDNIFKEVSLRYKSDVTIPKLVLKEENLLASIGKATTAYQKAEQQLILKDFLKYATMADQLFTVQRGSNFDTANFNDPYLVFKKIQQLEKARNSVITSVDDLINSSFIGTIMDKLVNTRDALALFLKSDQRRARLIIEKMLMPYINMSDDDFVKVARKIVSDLFDYAVQTKKGFAKEIERIMIEENNTPLRLKKLKEESENVPNHPLANNTILKNIEINIPERGKEFKDVHYVKIKGLSSKSYDQDSVIFAFRELRNYLQGINSDLYNDIVLLGVLQSGLSTSSVSFTSLIPFEDFEKVYLDVIGKLESFPDLETFYDVGAFQRNNWGNDDIVPRVNARLTQPNNYGLRTYNPAMAFLPDDIKLAVADGIIPPVMSLSQFSQESDADYIVYTWEKQEELITDEYKKKYPNLAGYKLISQIKTDMRKMGDYSFINKGLFSKVKQSDGTPFEYSYDRNGEPQKYFIYKMINAWGDSQKAKEFYNINKPSVIDNNMLKVKEIRSAFTAKQANQATDADIIMFYGGENKTAAMEQKINEEIKSPCKGGPSL